MSRWPGLALLLLGGGALVARGVVHSYTAGMLLSTLLCGTLAVVLAVVDTADLRVANASMKEPAAEQHEPEGLVASEELVVSDDVCGRPGKFTRTRAPDRVQVAPSDSY